MRPSSLEPMTDVRLHRRRRHRRPRAARPRRRRGPRRRAATTGRAIHFVGSDRGPETTLVPEAGFALTMLPGRGIPSAVSLEQPRAPSSASSAACAAGIGLVRRLRPAVVVVLRRLRQRALHRRRRPVAGADGGRRAERPGRARPTAWPPGSPRPCAVPFDGTDLPRAVVTGNPVRPEILAVDRARRPRRGPRRARPARRPAGRGRVQRLARLAAGSTRRCTGLAERWRAALRRRHPPRGRRPRLGRAAVDAASTAAEPADPAPTASCYQRGALRGPHASALLAAADVVVSRAGGTTVAELAVGRPRRRSSCRCRSPPATTRRPTPRRWCGAGAAVLVPDAELDADRLDAELSPLAGRARADWPPWPPPPTAGPPRRRRPGGRPRRGARPPWLTRPTSTRRASTSPHPARIHVVGVGGAGMSAIATVLAAMGHQVSGSDLQELGRPRAAARRWASTVAVGHDAANVPGRRRRWSTVSTAIPDRQPRGGRGPRSGGSRCCAGPRCWRPSPPTRQAIAVAGTHGKTTTSSMLALVLREAGLRPVVHHRRRRQRDRHGRGLGRPGELFVVEADESDGTFLELPRAGGRRHQRRARPPRPLRRLRAAARRRSRGSWPRPPGPCVVVRRRPARRRAGRAPRARSRYGTVGRRRLPHGRPDVPGGAARRFTRRRTTARELGRDPAADRRRPQRPQRRRGASSPALELGAPFEAAAGRAGPLRRRGPSLRAPGRGRPASPSSTTTPTCRPRWPPRSAAARDGDWGRVVCVFQPHRYSRTAALWPTFADAFGDADLAGGHRHLPGRRGAPARRHRASSSSTPCSTPIPGAAWPTCPAAPTWSPTSADELRPGDLCLTLGAGDLTSLPDELLERLEPAVAWPARVTRPARRRRSTAGWPRLLGDRARRDVPLGPLDHLPGGRAGRAAASRVDDDDDLRAGGRRPCAGSGDRRAGGRQGLEPARGRRRLRRAGRRAGRGRSPASRSTGDRRSRAGARPSLPVVARRTAAAGLTGFEWAVGVPGSIGGAVRMNAGGHGSDMAPSARRGPRARPRQRRGWVGARRAPRPRATGTRPSARHQVVIAAELRPRRRRPRPASEADDRRHRAVATRAPARRSERRLGVHQPAGRLRRPAHRRGRGQGPAGRHGRGLDQARQLHPGRRGRLGRRRARAHDRGPAPGARGHRHPPRGPRPAWSASARSLDLSIEGS